MSRKRYTTGESDRLEKGETGYELRVAGKKGIEQGAWRIEKDIAQWKVKGN
jgi:hypothetical protein